MSETVSSELDLRLTKAQELIGRGEQRQALDELWQAEALARGNAQELRQMLDFIAASGFAASIGASGDWRQPLSRESAELAEVVATLEHDVEQLSLARSAAESVGHYWPPSGFSAALLAIFALGGIGAILGVIIGAADASSCNPNRDICFGAGFEATYLALLLGIGGALAGLVGSLLVWLFGRIARHRSRGPRDSR
jgi:hypothetical protein